MSRFSVPTAEIGGRGAQPRSRIAQQPRRGAAGVLDGGEHGVRL